MDPNASEANIISKAVVEGLIQNVIKETMQKMTLKQMSQNP